MHWDFIFDRFDQELNINLSPEHPQIALDIFILYFIDSAVKMCKGQAGKMNFSRFLFK